MIEGVTVERDGDSFILRLRGEIEIASGDGQLRAFVREGVAFRLVDAAAEQLLDGAREQIGPWNEIRQRVKAEYEELVDG